MSRKFKPATAADVHVQMPAGPQTYLLLREAHSPKLGPRSVGGILFQVLTDTERQALFLRIAANEGGGYVSDEAVPVRSIMQCIADHPADQPLRAAALKPAFLGRSSNNPCFMAAVLLTEGLLSRDADKPHQLAATGRWDAWIADHMAIGGDLTEVRIGKEPAPAPADKAGAAPDAEAEPGQEGEAAAEVDADEVAAASEAEKPARGRRKARVAQE